MPEQGIYLFAVAASDRFARRLPIPALPDQFGDVEAITVDGIVALGSTYSGSAAEDIPQSEVVRNLVLHQKVIELARERDSVLPVRLGTIVPDEEAVCRLLRASADLIRDVWQRFRDVAEIDVAVTWDLDEVLKEVAADPEVRAARDAAQNAPAELRSSLAIDVGKLVSAKLDERRGDVQGLMTQTLLPHVRDTQHNALASDVLVCNSAFLVSAGEMAAFDDALRVVDTKLEGRYNFRRVGPLPAFSFATMHLREIGVDQLEAARKLLDLPDDYDEETVEAKYRALAVRLHPDTNPGDETAPDRFEDLSRARADLITACGNGGAGTGAPVLYFSVERSLGRG
ncbi:MAG: GvpL/GvpF family gas vesicle protein [Candidatus Nanopelagicales bacterium]|nr:GvpL/GvpF family gas vesicle protein [Candidatus Nanopelagicales bacterium]MDZ4249147.1 GvpL/GvpF family gas vesicle protein [Candidatus Nanopelagicales bacterium]MDZ7577487.1 GvpL/GvpF family gas vesicle protein [Candidatus Nanopelagicales bacterium]